MLSRHGGCHEESKPSDNNIYLFVRIVTTSLKDLLSYIDDGCIVSKNVHLEYVLRKFEILEQVYKSQLRNELKHKNIPNFYNKMRKITKLNNLEQLQMVQYNCSCFYSAVKYTLLCSRLVGLLPVSGLGNANCSKLRFKLNSPYIILYITSFFGQCLMFAMSFIWLLQNGITLTNITNSIFYSSSLISSILLLNIGRNWPDVILKIEEIETTLPPLKGNVAKYCKITMVFIFISAVVEHLLSIFYGVTVASACDKDNVTKTFFIYHMPWTFDYTPYALWKGILAEMFNIQSTFMWSFNDLLLMSISIYLTEHFILHNELLKEAVKQNNFSVHDFRVQYLKIVRLVRIVNGQTGIYILNSFGSNLYWICTQLFFSLNKTKTGHFVACHDKQLNFAAIHGIEHTIYFTYSFSFIVTRTLLVLLLAARIHSNSIEPLIVLYGLPSEKFDIEVERYISQIKNMKVALSGLDFFYVTRTMILTLLGTIVTYELVMLQFNK